MIPGKALKIARVKAGDTQKDAAARLKTTDVRISRIERSNDVDPCLYTLYLALTGQHPDTPGVFLTMLESGV